MGVVVLVLLIACANLANFLLAKTISREREISTRLGSRLDSSAHRWPNPIGDTLLSFSGGVLGAAPGFLGNPRADHFVVGGASYIVLDPGQTRMSCSSPSV